MLEHEEHCVHSEKRYGDRRDGIHAWMDEPSRITRGPHRQFRTVALVQTNIEGHSARKGELPRRQILILEKL